MGVGIEPKGIEPNEPGVSSTAQGSTGGRACNGSSLSTSQEGVRASSSIGSSSGRGSRSESRTWRSRTVLVRNEKYSILAPRPPIEMMLTVPRVQCSALPPRLSTGAAAAAAAAATSLSSASAQAPLSASLCSEPTWVSEYAAGDAGTALAVPLCGSLQRPSPVPPCRASVAAWGPAWPWPGMAAAVGAGAVAGRARTLRVELEQKLRDRERARECWECMDRLEGKRFMRGSWKCQ